MWPKDVETWVSVVLNFATILSTLFAIFAGLLGGLWAYTKFIIERGLLPGVQFDVVPGTVGEQKGMKLAEFLVHLKNVGTSILIVTNLRIDVLYLDSDASMSLFESGDGLQGKVFFPDSLRKDMREGKVILQKVEPKINERMTRPRHKAGKETRGLPILAYNTFVLPGVDQVYTFTTALPTSAAYVLIWSSFEYALSPTSLQRLVLSISRRLGLIHWSLQHVSEPHTIERVFKLQTS